MKMCPAAKRMRQDLAISIYLENDDVSVADISTYCGFNTAQYTTDLIRKRGITGRAKRLSARRPTVSVADVIKRKRSDENMSSLENNQTAARH